MNTNDKERHPRVFISYSHDSPKHANEVLGFANKLRSEGIDAILDQYEESPAEGWPKWMDRQIEDSDFILLVCTETYYQKVMGTVNTADGLGVKWESTLAYQEIYDAGGENTKFIPALFKDGKPEYIPRPLGGATYYCVETRKGYEDLYRRLTGQADTTKPGLGKLKSLGVRALKTNFFVDGGGGAPKKRTPKRYLICGIVTLVLLLLFWVIFTTPRLNLQTVVDYHNWEAPQCVKAGLRTIGGGQQKIRSVIDANSMYCILVRNESQSAAEHVALTIPDADHIEITRGGKGPQEIPPSGVIPLGKIQVKDEIRVNAWAACRASRYNAAGVAVYNELGTAPLYVRTPVGAISRWINKYITVRVVLISIIVGLVLALAYWLIKRIRLI